MLRASKDRLSPTRSQAEALNGMLGAFCDLYNAALQQRIEAYQRQRKSLRYGDQANQLMAVRLADERLAGYSYSAEQQILRRLDKAFAGFFRRLKTKGQAGFPKTDRQKVDQRLDQAARQARFSDPDSHACARWVVLIEFASAWP